MKTVLDRLMEIETQVAILSLDMAEMGHRAGEAAVIRAALEYDRIVRAMPEVRHVRRVGIYKGEWG